jgi:hypothetical protein
MTMDRGAICRVWLPLVVGLWAVGWIFQFGPGPHGLVRWIGLLLALIGLAGVILARYTLGRSFSIVPKAAALVTSGIYSRIRNPIYVFGMLAVVGIILIVGRPRLLVILAVLIPMQVIRRAAKPPCWKRSSATPTGNTASAHGSDACCLMHVLSWRIESCCNHWPLPSCARLGPFGSAQVRLARAPVPTRVKGRL